MKQKLITPIKDLVQTIQDKWRAANSGFRGGWGADCTAAHTDVSELMSQ